jgi:hypothetical protein
MPRARELLARFRPAGTPGAAAPAGVPADRIAELARELQPVFDELAGTEREAHDIRAAAAAEAQRRRDRAAEQARSIVAEARRDAEARRAEAAARVLHEIEQETTATLDAATREAAGIAGRAAGRYPGFVARVVAEVRAGIAGDAGVGSGP